MEWRDREGETWDRDVLWRIVGLLFALAGLADRAAGLPPCRRRQVLGILMHGEAEARGFVIGMAIGAPAPVDVPVKEAEAACMAARLRGLALVLCLLLARLPGRIGAARPRAGRCGSVRRAVSRHRAAAPAPDTS